METRLLLWGPGGREAWTGTAVASHAVVCAGLPAEKQAGYDGDISVSPDGGDASPVLLEIRTSSFLKQTDKRPAVLGFPFP